jgi:hypothetical protein
VTKLNDADKIYYGGAAAQRVYAGAVQAWPEAGDALPTIVASPTNATGVAMAVALSQPGDHLIHWLTSTTLVIPNLNPGFTALGSGRACDASGNDASVLLAVKKVATAAEGFPASSAAHRHLGVCVRNMDPNFIPSLLAGGVYDATIKAGFQVAGLTPVRPAPVMVFVKISGTTQLAFDGALGLTQIVASGAGSAEIRCCWTVNPVLSYAGGTIGTTPPATQARISATLPIYGRPL